MPQKLSFWSVNDFLAGSHPESIIFCPFRVTWITSQSLISLASPLLSGSYKREKDDCKAITAANIYFKDFFHCSFTLLLSIICFFLSLPSSVCSSLYSIFFIPQLMSSSDFFPTFLSLMSVSLHL